LRYSFSIQSNFDDILTRNVQKHVAKLSLVLDAWTSSNYFAFLAIVVRYINEDFELGECFGLDLVSCQLNPLIEEILVDFKELVGEHSGENLAEIVWDVLSTYGIANKVSIALM
jgi:hypothetical protein